LSVEDSDKGKTPPTKETETVTESKKEDEVKVAEKKVDTESSSA